MKMDDKVIEALQSLRRKLDREFHDATRNGRPEVKVELTIPLDEASYMIIGLEDVLVRARST